MITFEKKMEIMFLACLLGIWIFPIIAAHFFRQYKRSESDYELTAAITAVEWMLVCVGLMIYLVIESIK